VARTAVGEVSDMDDSLVTVATFLNHIEADLAKSALEAAGIESMIQSDDCGGVRPHLWMGGIQLLVRDEDAQRALEILNPGDTNR
jgi:Putative prokaryotic signal transducing protein